MKLSTSAVKKELQRRAGKRSSISARHTRCKSKPKPIRAGEANEGGLLPDDVDLVHVDDSGNGQYWRERYASQIRRKSRNEENSAYRIVGRGKNPAGAYWEELEWCGMFAQQNPNTYRYWNTDGSYYELFPDYSTYWSMYEGHERYISPKYGGFLRTSCTKERILKKAPHFQTLVEERSLNKIRGPGHVFSLPWRNKKKAGFARAF